MKEMQKDAIVLLNLDFLNFVPLMNFEEFFCQKSAVSNRCVKFVTAALRNAPIM